MGSDKKQEGQFFNEENDSGEEAEGTKKEMKKEARTNLSKRISKNNNQEKKDIQHRPIVD